MNAAERERIFEALFKSHFRDLTRFVFGYVNDEEAAKDIVHDAFLAIWQKLEFLDASYPMHPYLYTLCRNGALDYLKHLRVVNENERGAERPTCNRKRRKKRYNWKNASSR